MAEISKVKLPNNSEYDIRDTSKQPLLVSGTNIKTVNSSSLLGSGNLSVGTVTSVQAGTGLSISGTSTLNPTVNIGSNYKLPTTNEWNAKAPLASPALTGTPTAPTANAGTNTTQIATTAFVKTAIDNLPEPMLFKGSVGTDGTVTWANLPSAAAGNEGWTYKVITAHSADTKCPACKVGDTIISNGSAWIVIPSGDEPSGTVTSVGLSAPTGFSVSGSPVTSSGTLALSFASGYSLPTTAKQTNWDTAYSHATSKGSAFSSGLYKITTNSEGHVTAATAVAKSDITALGIPGSDTNTTYTLSSGAGTSDDTKIILTPSSGTAQKITVPYATTAGSATSAGSAPWTGITDRPTKLSQFTNDSGFITSSNLTTHAKLADTSTASQVMVSKSGGYEWKTLGTLTVGSAFNAQSALEADMAHEVAWGDVTSKPTTISGYGITDAKIASGVITLGSNTITPLTSHQSVTLASGTNNGTLKLTTAAGTTDNIAVKGLGSAAYTASSAYATSGHTHATSIAASSGTNQLTLAHNTKYAITAGGTSFVFTTPADNNTDQYVNQSETTTENWRKVILSFQNKGAGGSIDNTTNVVYEAASIEAQPSSGTLKANVLRAANNNVYVGSASGSQCHQQYDTTNKCLKFIFD